jgi:hypothetical protein
VTKPDGIEVGWSVVVGTEPQRITVIALVDTLAAAVCRERAWFD